MHSHYGRNGWVFRWETVRCFRDIPLRPIIQIHLCPALRLILHSADPAKRESKTAIPHPRTVRTVLGASEVALKLSNAKPASRVPISPIHDIRIFLMGEGRLLNEKVQGHPSSDS